MSDPRSRRGPAIAVALLAAAFLVSASIAVIEFVGLQAERYRVEEMEARDDGGGFFGDLGDAFQEAFGDGDGPLGEAASGASLLECLAPEGPFGGAGQAEFGGSVEAQVDAIAEDVERIRDLEFSMPVDPVFLTSEQTAQRVQQLFLEEYTATAADVDGRILTALGAIRAGTNLRTLQAEALGRQVAGFYEPETGELVVRTPGHELGAFGWITLAHELEHALADQRLGLPVPDDPVAGREDAELAALAVVEGDATLTMQRFTATLSVEAQLGLLPQAFAELGAAPSGLPHYLERSLLFPYQEGLAFVCELYARGGWHAVNRSYEDPPTTTAEILFPDRYPSKEAVDPPDPGLLRSPWRLEAIQQLGAANLQWLFEAPGGGTGRALSDPLSSVGGWAGGEVHLWTRGADSAVGISIAESGDEGRLCDSVTEWYGRSFSDDRVGPGAPPTTFDGGSQDAAIVCRSGEEVRIGIAPDLDTALVLVSRD